jgi:hypothetical protein
MARRKEIPLDVATLAISVQGRSANLVGALLRAAQLHRIDPRVLLALGEKPGDEDIDRMVRALLIRHPGLTLVANECRIEMPALARVTDEERAKDYDGEYCYRLVKDSSITEPFILRLATVFLPGEQYVSWLERDRRLLLDAGSLPGYQHARYLVQNQGRPDIAAALNSARGQPIHFAGSEWVSTRSTPANLRMMLVMRRFQDNPWELEWTSHETSVFSSDLFAAPGR